MKRNKILGAALAVALIAATGGSASAASPVVNATDGSIFAEIQTYSADQLSAISEDTVTLVAADQAVFDITQIDGEVFAIPVTMGEFVLLDQGVTFDGAVELIQFEDGTLGISMRTFELVPLAQ